MLFYFLISTVYRGTTTTLSTPSNPPRPAYLNHFGKGNYLVLLEHLRNLQIHGLDFPISSVKNIHSFGGVGRRRLGHDGSVAITYTAASASDLNQTAN